MIQWQGIQGGGKSGRDVEMALYVRRGQQAGKQGWIVQTVGDLRIRAWVDDSVPPATPHVLLLVLCLQEFRIRPARVKRRIERREREPAISAMGQLDACAQTGGRGYRGYWRGMSQRRPVLAMPAAMAIWDCERLVWT